MAWSVLQADFDYESSDYRVGPATRDTIER